MDGTCLTIHVKENGDTFQVNTEKDTPSDIISDKAGVVVSMVTRSGVPKVTVGDTVNAGDILVSGCVDVLNDAKEVVKQNYVYADADIVLETVNTYEDFLSKQYQKKKYTDRERSLWTLQWNTFSASIGLPQNKFEHFETHTEKTQVKLDENFYLPIFIGKKQLLEYKLETMEYSNQELENLLKNRFERQCEKWKETAVIIENNLQLSHDKEGAKAQGNVILQETVGIHRKIVDF